VYLAEHLGILRLLLFSRNGLAVLGDDDQLLGLLRLGQSAILAQTLHTLDPHVVLLQLVVPAPADHWGFLDLRHGNDLPFLGWQLLPTLLLLFKFLLLLIRWGGHILLLGIVSIYWVLLLSGDVHGFTLFDYLVLPLDELLLLSAFLVGRVSLLLILLLLFVHEFLKDIKNEVK